MRSEPPLSLRQALLARLWLICKPRVVRQALLAAGLAGTLLVALNQGDVWVSGHVTRRILLKSLLTLLIPFCVTMLGAFLHSRPAMCAEDLRPGWATIQRSLIIALAVGSTIILLNHGDVLLAGALTPQVVVKMLVTPCVPFCVSFYGAYAAYQQALAEQQHGTGMA